MLEELARIRAEVGSPPLASPIGQILGSQALVHVLSAERYQTVVDELKALIAGHFGSPPAAIDPTVERAVELIGGEPPEEQPVDVASAREVGDGLATSDEELCLLALFGEDAEPLLRTIRGRGRRDEEEATSQEPTRSERIREIVRIVQESGVQEVTLEDAGMRVTVRRQDEGAATPSRPHFLPRARSWSRCWTCPSRLACCASRRRWSAPSTGRPSLARTPSSASATLSSPARRSASSRR